MLNVVSYDEAIEIINKKFKRCRPDFFEEVPLCEASGRILFEDIKSPEDIPGFSRSTMDGYAVTASDTFGSGQNMPAFLNVKGTVLMGENTVLSVKSGECVKISTGGMLPEGANAVVPVEYTEENPLGECLVYAPVSPLQNVTSRGDDVKEGDTVTEKGTRLSFNHIGVLAAMGMSRIKAVKKPVAGIISTGDEVEDIDSETQTGKIRDVNSYLLLSMCEKYGCEGKRLGIVKDKHELISKAIDDGIEKCDILLLSGGSSAGERDMTAQIIREKGQVYIHGIAMKPGKPTIIGEIKGKPVIGLPGHPAACFFVTETVVKPLIKLFTGEKNKISCREYEISENVSSNNGREEFLCVKTEGDICSPLHAKSGIISLLAKCDGYIRIPRDLEGLKLGERVKVYSFD